MKNIIDEAEVITTLIPLCEITNDIEQLLYIHFLTNVPSFIQRCKGKIEYLQLPVTLISHFKNFITPNFHMLPLDEVFFDPTGDDLNMSFVVKVFPCIVQMVNPQAFVQDVLQILKTKDVSCINELGLNAELKTNQQRGVHIVEIQNCTTFAILCCKGRRSVTFYIKHLLRAITDNDEMYFEYNLNDIKNDVYSKFTSIVNEVEDEWFINEI